jgi:hypothetical protein
VFNAQLGGDVTAALLLVSSTSEEVSDAEHGSPVIEVSIVEQGALNLENAEDVGPLSIRDLVSESEPDELMQESVLWARKADGDRAFWPVEVFPAEHVPSLRATRRRAS